jgi:hypothetical protein
MRAELFSNPFLGQAVFMWPDHQPLPRSNMLSSCANTMLEAASYEEVLPGFNHRVSRNALRTDDCARLCQASKPLQNAPQVVSAFNIPADLQQGLDASVQHLKLFKTLYAWDADPDSQALPLLDTPIMIAASQGNVAATEILCRMGSWLELRRYALQECVSALLYMYVADISDCVFVCMLYQSLTYATTHTHFWHILACTVLHTPCAFALAQGQSRRTCAAAADASAVCHCSIMLKPQRQVS